jgi:ABC-type multidrug transport system fused ATPase/permease subunit
MVLAFYGAKEVRPILRAALGYGTEGSTVQGLVSAARIAGFDAEAFVVTAAELSRVPLPAVLHWHFSHYVVLEGETHGEWSIIDPAVGRRRISRAEIERDFSGVAIAVEPMIAAPPCPEPLRRSAHLPRRVIDRPVRLAGFAKSGSAALALVVISTLSFASVTSLVTKWANAPGARTNFSGGPIWPAILFAATLAAEGALCVLDRRTIRRFGEATAEYWVDAVTRVPPMYVMSRTERFLENAALDADPLVTQDCPRPSGLLRIVGATLLVGAVARVSFPVALSIGLVAIAHVAILGVRSPTRRAPRLRSSYEMASRRLRFALAHPEQVFGLGVFVSELNRWPRLRRQAAGDSAFDCPRPSESRGIGLTLGVTLISVVVLTEYGRGRQSLNEMLYLEVLGAAAVALFCKTVVEWSRLHDWRARMAVIEDIGKECHEQEPSSDNVPPLTPQRSGVVLECRNVCYSSSPDSSPLLSGIDLLVSPRDSIAIIGKSGAGKTLLAQILLGMRRPSGGVILLSGPAVVPQSGEARRPNSIVGVFDDSGPADGTISGFLRSTTHATESDLWIACALLGLDTWLARLPLGLNTPVARQGANFASHQRRLLCLAQLLVSAPSVVVIDATLDALDDQRAAHVAAILSARLSSVILMTTRGSIVPRGYRRLQLAAGQLCEERLEDPFVSDREKAL